MDGSTLLRVIDWGILEQGKTYNYSFIVKNNGTTPLELHLKTLNSGWERGPYGYLSWDREGYVLDPGATVTATLTWQISSIAPIGVYREYLTIGIEGEPLPIPLASSLKSFFCV